MCPPSFLACSSIYKISHITRKDTRLDTPCDIPTACCCLVVVVVALFRLFVGRKITKLRGRVGKTQTHVLRKCIRKENAAVPATKVKTLDALISKFSSKSCPARSLSGSLGGLDHGSGRYLWAGKEGQGREGKGRERVFKL